MITFSFKRISDVGDAGQVSLGEEQRPSCPTRRARPNRPSPPESVRNIRPPFRSSAMPMPSIKWVNRISGAGRALRIRIHRGAVHRVAARRIAAVGPVQDAILEIELQIDRLGQPVEEHFDVRAIRRASDLSEFRCRRGRCGPCPRCPGLFASSRPCPPSASTAMPTHHFVWIAARSGVALARVHESLDVRPVEVGAHQAHPFAVAPVQLSALLFELELLGSECAALGNDRLAIPPVEVSSLDGAVVRRGVAHIGPVDVSRRDIDGDAIGVSALGDDDLAVGAVRVQRQDTVVAEVEKEQAADCVFVAGRTSRFLHL